GYSAYGPRGPGYYVGLPDFSANNGPSGAFSPIFNAMAAAPRDSAGLGPTYGGYAYSVSRFGSPAPIPQPLAYPSTPAPAHAAQPGITYSSAYVPPGWTGTPAPEPPRPLFRRIFGRR